MKMKELKAKPGARTWTSTTGTKDRVLDAASEIFARKGFTDTTMADLVEASGVSVGSIYHHFGGKSEVFMAIWNNLVERMGLHVGEALEQARVEGVTDRIELFEVSTRAYLESIWQNQSRARVVAMGDTPPGFDAVRRGSARRGGGNDIELLGLSSGRREHLFGDFHMAIRAEAARAVLGCRTPEATESVIEDTLRVIRRLDPREFEFEVELSQ